MVKTQIICPSCKQLRLIENRTIVPHFVGDVECEMSGTKYVPQKRFSSSSEEIADLVSRMPPLPPGSEVLGAAAIRCCPEHDSVVGGVALVAVPPGSPSPQEFAASQAPVQTKSEKLFELPMAAPSKFGAN